MNQKNKLQLVQLLPKDTELMRLVLHLFGEAFKDKKTYCHKQPENSYLELLLSKDHHIVIAAVSSNQVIGALVAYMLHKFEQQRSEIYIYELAVCTSWRRKGIATKLLNKLQSEAKKRGVHEIVIQADYDNESAIKLYEKFGKKEKVFHFDIKFDKN